jgi:hypothetical protein
MAFGIDELYECPANDDDCDRLLDDGDPCPADPGDAMDEDHDGVGDACDPNLSSAGDTISVFDGFSRDPSTWMVMSGTAAWSEHDSSMVQPAADDGVLERLLDTFVQPTVELSISATLGEDGSAVGAYVATPAKIPLECRIVHHATGDDLLMFIGTAMVASATNIPGKIGDGLRLYGGQLPLGAIRCRARYGTNDAISVDYTASFITPRATIDRVGLRTIKASAEFHAVVIYSVP